MREKIIREIAALTYKLSVIIPILQARDLRLSVAQNLTPVNARATCDKLQA